MVGGNDKSILRVENLTKNFGGVTALNNVSFELKKGEILGLMGPNGSGKTTLINCITGFLKPESGKVYFKDRDITGIPPHRIADMGIGRTFQIMRPYYSMPAYKNLIVPLFSPRARILPSRMNNERAFGRSASMVKILALVIRRSLISPARGR